MIDVEAYQKEQSEKGYQVPYIVQLLLETEQKLDPDRLLEALRKHCGSVEPMEEQSGLLVFAHPEQLMRVKEGLVPTQSMFTETELIEKPLDFFSSSLTQTWDWPDAEQAVARTKAVIGITDSFTDGLTRKTRLKLFHSVVQAALELTQPVAIHWLPSQRIVSPDRYREDLGQGGQLFSSAVNVRMFKVEESNERVMDTMGLTGLGCPDVQCHFINLDPAQIGLYLYQLAEYVFERGDIFRDGDTLEGLNPKERWKCRKEPAYVNPKRRVVNVIPGQYAPSTQSEGPQ